MVTLLTERTELRAWRPSDRDAFAALNADPAVMEHFPSPLDRVQSDDFADRISSGLEKRGWGLWAMELPGRFEFVGFVGLNEPGFDVPVDLAETPPLEVGWRLGQAAWNQGLASEAALEVLRFAFAELGRREVVSFTTPGNDRSRRVMEKLGLHTDPRDDFDHPHMAELGHDRVTRHVLYRIGAAEHAAQEHDTARRQLRDHVGRFNLGVRSGDWSAMLRSLAPDAVFTAVGAAAGVLRVEGRDAIGVAYAADPPSDEIVVFDPVGDGDHGVVARWSDACRPERVLGDLCLHAGPAGITALAVTFD